MLPAADSAAEIRSLALVIFLLTLLRSNFKYASRL